MTDHPKCYNRPPYQDHVYVQNGWTEDGRRIMAYIPDDMSKGCPQHGPLGEATLKKWNCEGCRWKPVI
jgi:hypothetical protein